MSNAEAFATATRKAKFGSCRNWLVWEQSPGDYAIGRFNTQNVKRALLSVGTRGKFFSICGVTGHTFRVKWREGIVMFRNLKAGYL